METAESLAIGHFKVEPNLKQIFLIEPIDEQDNNEPIKLLEVVEGTIERGIEPVTFAAEPAHKIYYPSMIIEVSPSEFQHIRAGKLKFENRNWEIGKELSAK